MECKYRSPESPASQCSVFDRIPDTELKPRIVSVQRGSRRSPGRTTYGKDNYCDSGLFKRQLEALWGYIQKADPQKKREPETGLFDVVLYLFLWGSGLPVKVACVETSLFESMFILDRGVETQSAGVERST